MRGEQWILSTLISARLSAQSLVTNFLKEQLVKYGLDEQTMRWIENKLNG